MADENIMLNNYSDDSQIKSFMMNVLAPRVFHDIPINVLNSGMFSLTSEYISQITEQLSFTSSFYFNEGFITKAVLPDSIYAEAAIFNIGYSFATPASTNILLELRISDIYNNAVFNATNGLYEFILDKNTKFNLPEGYTYSLDYDILIQYKDKESSSTASSIPAWNVQYTNMDEPNVCATNKRTYITYRVTDVWLCLMVQVNEYERSTYSVVNTMTNGVPNEDKVISCQNHIAGFDVTYIDGNGNRTPLPRNHILAIHDTVPDGDPYVHYIMDNQQTIRFLWQFNGSRYFIPEPNSSFEIVVYTCHGKSANAPNYKNEKQPSVIAASNRFTNNANVTKAAFVIGGCVGGTDIGSVESVRRDTIEAYNTANVLSTDHDLDEWFKTFYFKNVLYPYFFKRRDDPWCRTWSGYIALNENDNYIYKTNTLHAHLTYRELYNNADNTVSKNEIIIPPGWVWVYTDDTYSERDKYVVVPYTKADGKTIENARTLATINDEFVFANPFGIRIQKDPFAIGYFNPWVNQFVTGTRITKNEVINVNEIDDNDVAFSYHASHIISNIVRTYKDDCYTLTTHILPTVPSDSSTGSTEELVKHVRVNVIPPQFTAKMFEYFQNVQDIYAETIPMLVRTNETDRIPFNPERTYLCATKNQGVPENGDDPRINASDWILGRIWLEDNTNSDGKVYQLPITASGIQTFGSDDIWGENGIAEGQETSEDVTITIAPGLEDDSLISFERVASQNYYEMRLKESSSRGSITKITVGEVSETDLQKFGENKLVRLGKSYQPTIYINVYYNITNSSGDPVTEHVSYAISNAANIYSPGYISTSPDPSNPTYTWVRNEEEGVYECDFNNVGPTGIILYADMKPAPQSGSYSYYRVKFSDIPANTPLFYVHSDEFPMDENYMRVVAHALVNGSETGYVEMQPVKRESDGSYEYQVTMYPLNELIDIDNRINISSVYNGGGSWIPTNVATSVSLDASDPQIKISVLMKTKNPDRPSEVSSDSNFTGYKIVDEYMLDDLSLVQELKEMRSVVKFEDTTEPTEDQYQLYKDYMALVDENPSSPTNLFFMIKYAYNRAYDKIIDPEPVVSFEIFKQAANENLIKFSMLCKRYDEVMSDFDRPAWFSTYMELLHTITEMTSYTDVEDWMTMYNTLNSYVMNVNATFGDTTVNVNGGIEIQLVPFVESSLMTSVDNDGRYRFADFVSAFTQVHKAIEPVIFKRLDGNHYLDCKLIGTYGKSRTYVSDTSPDEFWPSLNLQLEFDVRLFNKSLSTNTINELRLIVKSYFNRITTVHSPNRDTNMDNNIYISHLIQQMEAHDNVAWMKFKGWYTNKKDDTSYYKDANTQAIELKWNQLEEMGRYENGESRLENFTPEMFILEDDNIVINIV